MSTSAATWATRVTEIETAIYNLALGNRVVRLTSPDGTLVEYQQADLKALQDLLEWARTQASAASGSPRGPIYVIPG